MCRLFLIGEDDVDNSRVDRLIDNNRDNTIDIDNTID